LHQKQVKRVTTPNRPIIVRFRPTISKNRPFFHAEWPGNGQNGPDRGKGAGAFQPPEKLYGGNTGGRTSGPPKPWQRRFLSANKKRMAGWKTRPPLREMHMTDKALKEIMEKIRV